jgi:hypothetical protein
MGDEVAVNLGFIIRDTSRRRACLAGFNGKSLLAQSFGSYFHTMKTGLLLRVTI